MMNHARKGIALYEIWARTMAKLDQTPWYRFKRRAKLARELCKLTKILKQHQKESPI